MAEPARKLGIIAGQGSLPGMVAAAAKDHYPERFMLAFEGDTAPETIRDIPHQWLKIEEIARVLEIFEQEEITHIVMAGKLQRPHLQNLKPRLLAAKIMARLGTALFAGDDALFKGITHIFEEEGFVVVGADSLLADLLTPEGILTEIQPDEKARQDIAKAIPAVKAIGKLDIGQGCIIKHGQILGVEAREGTDALIQRCAALHDPEVAGGVLVKAKKPGQEHRVDMPAIGPQTIENLAKAGFTGVAVEANGSLLIEQKKAVALANQKGLFIQGFSYDATE